jgi:protein involved in polysaccharide export with SLBB domain
MKNCPRQLLFLLAALLAVFPAGKIFAADTNPPAAESTTARVTAMDDKYRLTVGDQVSFQVVEDEEDPKQLAVTDSGDLQVPYIGRFSAAGKTCRELADALKVELEKTYYYHATVIVAVDAKPRSSGKIYIVGAVRGPGPLEISGDETLTASRAILRAGGFTEFADQRGVRITRAAAGGDAKKIITVNVEQVFEKGKTENDVELQPGDLIFVPERMLRF